MPGIGRRPALRVATMSRSGGLEFVDGCRCPTNRRSSAAGWRLKTAGESPSGSTVEKADSSPLASVPGCSKTHRACAGVAGLKPGRNV